MFTTLRLLAGTSSSGELAFEEVLAEPLEGGQYKLSRSPGLVLNIAAGDTFELVGDDGKFKVLRRGGNIAVQLFDPSSVSAAEPEATRRLQPLGGTLDGKTDSELVYTVPAAAGFPRLEAELNEIIARHPSLKWYYGNVYDPRDGVTPLGWWNDA